MATRSYGSDKVGLHLYVSREIKNNPELKGQLSRILTMAVEPLIQGNGHSRASLLRRLQELEQQEIQIHAELEMIRLQLHSSEIPLGPLARSVIMDDLLGKETEDFRRWKDEALSGRRMSEQSKKNTALGRCKFMFEREPRLRAQFTTPDGLLDYLMGVVGRL